MLYIYICMYIIDTNHNMYIQRLKNDNLMAKPKGEFKYAKGDLKWAGIHTSNVLLHLWLNRMPLEPVQLFNEKNVNELLSKSMRMLEVMLEIVANPRARFLVSTLNIIEFMQLVRVYLYMQ